MKSFMTSLPGVISLLGILLLILWRVSFLLSGVLPALPVRPPELVLVRIIVTMLVLISSLYVVLTNKYEPDTEKWAFGTIGLVLGYWLPAAC